MNATKTVLVLLFLTTSLNPLVAAKKEPLSLFSQSKKRVKRKKLHDQKKQRFPEKHAESEDNFSENIFVKDKLVESIRNALIENRERRKVKKTADKQIEKLYTFTNNSWKVVLNSRKGKNNIPVETAEKIYKQYHTQLNIAFKSRQKLGFDYDEINEHMRIVLKTGFAPWDHDLIA